VLLSLAWFKFLTPPFVGPAAIAAGCCLLGVRRARSDLAKALLIGLATISLVGAAAEAYWWRRTNSGRPTVSYPESYLRYDGALGYALVPGAVQRLSLGDGNSLWYDVVYTVDSLGLRVSPPPTSPAPADCIVFFGDSFTIGEGVPDSATMPYRVAIRTRGKFGVNNFAVHGYGPNHMLALLETGKVARTLSCAPRHVIYAVIPAHVGRAAGKLGWRGPRYRLEPDGSVRRDGLLMVEDLQDLTWRAYLKSQFEKSALLNVLRARLSSEDRQRFLSIVATAARSVERDFPGAEFHVLFWATIEDDDSWIVDGLRKRGLRVHLVEDALAGYRTDRDGFRIPGDGHPNARAHDELAAYVVSKILQEPTIP